MSASTGPRDHPTTATSDLRRVLLVDGLLALAVASSSIPNLLALAPIEGVTAEGTSITTPSLLWWTVFSFVLCLPLVVRRLWPRGSHAAIVALAVLPMVVDTILLADSLPLLVSLFSVVSLRPGWRSPALATVATVLAISIPGLYPDWGALADVMTPIIILTTLTYTLTPVLLVVAGAWALRLERQRSEGLQREAVRLALVGDARAEAAAATERRRLAAELHDIVAHHVNLMVVQAETGPYVPDQGAARATFTTIAQSGRTALGELDRLLGVLRRDGNGSPGSAPMGPLPTLEEIPALVESASRAGVPITLDRFEVPAALDPALAATGHRIVQECVTNVIKHGDHAETARISIEHAGDALRIRVDNRIAPPGPGGRRSPGDRDGHGLLSIRSRLEVFGGTLEIDDSDGRFRVEVVLPLVAGARTPVDAGGGR